MKGMLWAPAIKLKYNGKSNVIFASNAVFVYVDEIGDTMSIDDRSPNNFLKTCAQ